MPLMQKEITPITDIYSLKSEKAYMLTSGLKETQPPIFIFQNKCHMVVGTSSESSLEFRAQGSTLKKQNIPSCSELCKFSLSTSGILE